MEPIRPPDYPSLLSQLGQAAGQKADQVDPQTAMEFERMLEDHIGDKGSQAGGSHAEQLKEVLDDKAEETAERIAQIAQQPAVPAQPQGPEVADDPMHRFMEGHGGGRRSSSSPLPVGVPGPFYRPPDTSHRVAPDGQRLPRQEKRRRQEVTVDADLVEVLKAHGLLSPVVSPDDRRLQGEVRFESRQGWARVGTETAWSATWRSPQDPVGVYQRCTVTDEHQVVETCAREKIQTIEVRGDSVTVTRTAGPPPGFSTGRP